MSLVHQLAKFVHRARYEDLSHRKGPAYPHTAVVGAHAALLAMRGDAGLLHREQGMERLRFAAGEGPGRQAPGMLL